MHAEHVRAGARFLDAGLWKRPERYAEIAEEVLAVRNSLGIIDVSTLGKLELTGPDALQLLNFMLPGDYSNLSVGRVRYHTMVGEDGILFEDGTISHIDEGRYFLSTTTGNADAIRSMGYGGGNFESVIRTGNTIELVRFGGSVQFRSNVRSAG